MYMYAQQTHTDTDTHTHEDTDTQTDILSVIISSDIHKGHQLPFPNKETTPTTILLTIHKPMISKYSV